jgi:hypothetical protein
VLSCPCANFLTFLLAAVLSSQSRHVCLLWLLTRHSCLDIAILASQQVCSSRAVRSRLLCDQGLFKFSGWSFFSSALKAVVSQMCLGRVGGPVVGALLRLFHLCCSVLAVLLRLAYSCSCFDSYPSCLATAVLT